MVSNRSLWPKPRVVQQMMLLAAVIFPFCLLRLFIRCWHFKARHVTCALHEWESCQEKGVVDQRNIQSMPHGMHLVCNAAVCRRSYHIISWLAALLPSRVFCFFPPGFDSICKRKPPKAHKTTWKADGLQPESSRRQTSSD